MVRPRARLSRCRPQSSLGSFVEVARLALSDEHQVRCGAVLCRMATVQGGHISTSGKTTEQVQPYTMTCELQSEHLSDETSETHGSETILTQRSLHNERAVAESSFDGILDVGAPCLLMKLWKIECAISSV